MEYILCWMYQWTWPLYNVENFIPLVTSCFLLGCILLAAECVGVCLCADWCEMVNYCPYWMLVIGFASHHSLLRQFYITTQSLNVRTPQTFVWPLTLTLLDFYGVVLHINSSFENIHANEGTLAQHKRFFDRAYPRNPLLCSQSQRMRPQPAIFPWA